MNLTESIVNQRSDGPHNHKNPNSAQVSIGYNSSLHYHVTLLILHPVYLTMERKHWRKPDFCADQA